MTVAHTEWRAPLRGGRNETESKQCSRSVSWVARRDAAGMAMSMPNVIRGRRMDLPFLWLCALILSFCYELPLLQISTYDRLNPRLFDLVSLLGVPLLFAKRRDGSQPRSAVLQVWGRITGVFLLCSVVWTIVVPDWEIGKYCLYYGARYLQGWMVLRCATKIAITDRRKRTIAALMVAGGLFVALYAAGEYWSPQTSAVKQRRITDEKVVVARSGSIFGPLSPAYFHIGTFSVLSFALALGIASHVRRPRLRWIAAGIAAFIGWPAAFCGSRAALFGIMTVIITMSITSAAIRKQLLVCGVFLGLLVAWYRQEVNAEGLSRLSLTVNRLFELEEDPGEESSIEGRLIGGLDFSPSGYLFTSFIPLFGAGFYVAPVIGRYKAPDAMIGAQGETYRVGFGIHNMFLFPLEQGGIVAVILFFLFLRAIKRGLNRARKEGVAATRGFATGTHAFFFAMLVMGMGGQMFWYFEGSGNLVFYIVLTFILSTTELPPPARTKPLPPIARRG